MTALLLVIAVILFAFGYVAGVAVLRQRWSTQEAHRWDQLARRDTRRNHDDFLPPERDPINPDHDENAGFDWVAHYLNNDR